MYYLYVLKHTSGDTYVGFTSSVYRRLRQHNNGENVSTKRNSGHWNLVYYEAYGSKLDAWIREQKLKLRGATKYNLFNRIKNSFALFEDEKYTDKKSTNSQKPISFGF